MEHNTFQGKVIAVTGGASGIGLALVRKLILLKARVAVADLSPCPSELKDVPDLIFTKLDVSSRAAVHEWVEDIVAKFGRLDGMAANAGIAPHEGEIASDQMYNTLVGVNLTGVWNCGTEAYWQFKKQGGGGTIVNTASASVVRHGPQLTAYGATKAAVVALTEGWAVEWGHLGIRVNCVGPGTTRMPLQADALKNQPDAVAQFEARTPLRRLGEPQELADALLFFLGESSTYVTGQTLYVDGGYIKTL